MSPTFNFESGDTIKGFLLQARMDGKPVGKFTVQSSSKKHSQLLNCSDGQGVSKRRNPFDFNFTLQKKAFCASINLIKVQK